MTRQRTFLQWVALSALVALPLFAFADTPTPSIQYSFINNTTSTFVLYAPSSIPAFQRQQSIAPGTGFTGTLPVDGTANNGGFMVDGDGDTGAYFMIPGTGPSTQLGHHHHPAVPTIEFNLVSYSNSSTPPIPHPLIDVQVLCDNVPMTTATPNPSGMNSIQQTCTAQTSVVITFAPASSVK